MDIQLARAHVRGICQLDADDETCTEGVQRGLTTQKPNRHVEQSALQQIAVSQVPYPH